MIMESSIHITSLFFVILFTHNQALSNIVSWTFFKKFLVVHVYSI